MFLDLPSLFFESLLIVFIYFGIIDKELLYMDHEHLQLLAFLKTKEKASNRLHPQVKCCHMWAEIWDKFSDTLFWWMFQMKKEQHEILCLKNIDTVGEEGFKPCHYLMSKQTMNKEKGSEFHGGVISGELKLAMTIHMLAGASYLDLLDTYDVGSGSVFTSFHQAISWIILCYI
jgi:hypothetical protein